ncbi:MAG: short-chain dehydrogenase [Deltaproteobacteria bacterium HGW-Deltaproteobacteria-22]|jgi:NAD(P)-dependent dehydrogenase (short-subunit alcohol dehydrogenase family)|nr:MAG: short-chain dehydrogenase [Deltaproteobacteria bacterium HGW-Deltaproteobacteria-22]
MKDHAVALITGANKGLGFEIARQLGRQGLCVVLGARDLEKGDAAASVLRSEGCDAHAVQLDVAREQDVQALPAFFTGKFGRLDVLVNNAGVAEWALDDLDSFRRTFEPNLFGVVATTYALLQLIKESPAGRIVNQSSQLGSLTSITKHPEMFGGFVVPAYTASKAALNGFTVALALKLGSTRVKVNSAHPGWARTELGGDAAPMTAEAGARTAVRLATLPDDGPTGRFFHLDDELPW